MKLIYTKKIIFIIFLFSGIINPSQVWSKIDFFNLNSYHLIQKKIVCKNIYDLSYIRYNVNNDLNCNCIRDVKIKSFYYYSDKKSSYYYQPIIVGKNIYVYVNDLNYNRNKVNCNCIRNVETTKKKIPSYFSNKKYEL